MLETLGAYHIYVHRETRKWGTKPKVENPSSVAPSDRRPRPLCICAWTAELRSCGAAGHSATGTHMHSQPPSPATPRTRSSGASRFGLSLTARHATEHPPMDTLSRRPGCFRQAAPTVPSYPGFSPLLAPIPKRKILASSLRAQSEWVQPAGAAPWPRIRAAINRRLPAGRGAGRGARGCRGAAWEA